MVYNFSACNHYRLLVHVWFCTHLCRLEWGGYLLEPPDCWHRELCMYQINRSSYCQSWDPPTIAFMVEWRHSRTIDSILFIAKLSLYGAKYDDCSETNTLTAIQSCCSSTIPCHASHTCKWYTAAGVCRAGTAWAQPLPVQQPIFPAEESGCVLADKKLSSDNLVVVFQGKPLTACDGTRHTGGSVPENWLQRKIRDLWLC